MPLQVVPFEIGGNRPFDHLSDHFAIRCRFRFKCGFAWVNPTPATHALWEQLKAGETNTKIIVSVTYNRKTLVLQPFGVQTVSDCPAFNE